MTGLPNGWAIAQLAEICHIEMGQSPPSSTYNTDGVGLPFLQGKGEFGSLYPTPAKYCSSPSKIARTGSVLLSVRAPVGPSNIALGKCCVGRGLAAILPLGDIPVHFVLWALRSHEPALAKSGTGSTFAAISKHRVVSIPIKLPPLNEQHRIIEKIEELFNEIDRGVDALRVAKSTLDLYRKSLLKSAFEGTLTAEWRAQNPDKLESPDALLARILEERQARYEAALEEWERAVAEWRKGSEKDRKPTKPKQQNGVAPLEVREIEKLPDIPSPWAFSRMGLYIDRIEAGKSFKCLEEEPRGDQIGVAKVSAVTWGEYDETESKTCLDDVKINGNLFIREGDFLLSRANTIKLVGASVITEKVTKRIMISDKTLRIHFMTEDRRFFLHYLRSPHGRAEIEARSTGNQESMRNIGQDRIKDIIVPICSLAEKAEIVRILDSRLEATNSLDAEIDAALARADALRQSILKKAFSGQLVPQDPTDEPASTLLVRIQSEGQSANKNPPRKVVSS